jgi:hypothetical protein
LEKRLIQQSVIQSHSEIVAHAPAALVCRQRALAVLQAVAVGEA